MDAGMHMGVGICAPLFPARASYTHAGARAGTDAGVGVQGEQGPTQGFAQDVASIVCKHLENHRLGQLDMKVVLERKLSKAL